MAAIVAAVAADHPKTQEGGLTLQIFTFHFWFDKRGQNLIEWALLTGLLAMAAGAIMPGVAESIGTAFSNLTTVLNKVNSPGSSESSASSAGFAAPRARD